VDNQIVRKQTPAMRQGVAALEDASAQIKSIYGSVNGAQDGFRHAWDGSASSQFTGGLDTWLHDLNVILDTMNWLRDNLAVVDKDLTNAEDHALMASKNLFHSNLNPPVTH
jgi:uncharacterized protein YukE